MFEVDDAAWSLLAWLEDEGQSELDEAHLREVVDRLGLHAGSATALVGSDRVLVGTDRRIVPFESIVLRVDDGELVRMLSQDLRIQPLAVTVDAQGSTPCKRSIVVTFQTSYREAPFLEQINDGTRNLYLNSHLLGDHLHIDAPYLPHLGTPCHGCHALRLRYQLAASESHGQAGWLYYEGVLQAAGIAAIPRLPLTNAQRGLVAFHLFRSVAAFLGGDMPRFSAERLQERCVVDLEYGTTTREAVTHWSHCDCVC